MNKFLADLRKTHDNLSKGWNNDDGYIQPIISFNGMLIVMAVLVAVLGYALYSA